MHAAHAGGVLDLPAARLRVAHHTVGPGVRDLGEEPGADLHGDVVLLPLEAVRPGDAAAVRVALHDPELGHEHEEVERRLADAVALLLAGGVVDDGLRYRPE